MKRRGRAASEAPGLPGTRSSPSSSSSSSSSSSAAAAAMGQGASKARSPQQHAWGLLDWLQASKMKTAFLVVFVLYASLPFVIWSFPSLLRKFVYLNFLVFPLGVDFQKPEVYLNHTANFYLTSEPGITFGFWHALPDNRRRKAEGKDRSWYEEALADDNPIIVYLHGNGGTRATSHRVLFTKVMSDGGFHVLAVDYRGYADSTGYPSENGFTKDVLCVYNWVKARSGNSTVIFWGHSLGTGIATNTARHLKEKGSSLLKCDVCRLDTDTNLRSEVRAEGVTVDAIVLEAPYTNIRDAAANIPFTKIYRKFPGFETLILDTMGRADMYFPNDENVQVLSSPLLILHSEDDVVVPAHLGRKLYEIAQNTSAKKEHVQFVAFPASMGLGHDHISRNPDLPVILKKFLKSVQ